MSVLVSSAISLGDILKNGPVYFHFNTHTAAGVPVTLAGSPALSIYKAEGAVESTAGISISIDFDGRTGLHRVSLDLSDGFYATGQDFSVVITTGTVVGNSVVGAVIARFTIENSNNNLRAINGDLTNGNNAVLKLKQINIQSDANLDAVYIKGSGTGHGIRTEGGAGGVGAGLWCQGAGNGDGATFAGTGTGSGISAGGINGIIAVGGLNGHGIEAIGVGTGHGMQLQGGNTGNGINAVGGDNGVKATGSGTGHGVNAQSGAGATGDGIHAESNATAGNGMNVIGKGNASGLKVVAVGNVAALDIYSGATGRGVRIAAAADGVYIEGGQFSSLGHGLHIKGGDTAGGSAAKHGVFAEVSGGIGDGVKMLGSGAGKDINASQIDDIKAKTDNLPHSIKKNTAIAKFKFVMLDATTGNPTAGFSVTATKKLDAGGTWLAMPGSGTIVDNGSGVYSIDIAQADTNGDTGAWRFTAPGAETTLITFVTEAV